MLLGVEEHVVQDRWMWKAVIPIPDGKTQMFNENDDGDDDVKSRIHSNNDPPHCWLYSQSIFIPEECINVANLTELSIGDTYCIVQ